jgi:phospho-N-acetylmuramoyl-pentapeptide-transferase
MDTIIKIIIPSALTWIVGIFITPIITDFLYKHKMWKKKSVHTATDGHSAAITNKIHNDAERKTPRMGGVVIWGSVMIVIFSLFVLSFFFDAFKSLSYFSRSQTWIPLCVFIVSALFGLVDDYLVCKDKGTYNGGGLSLRYRLLFVTALGLFVGMWLYFKLDYTALYITNGYVLHVGWFVIILSILVSIGMYSGGIIDGVDGLSGGVFASMFSAYGFIALLQGQIDLATLCLSIVGGILAFLWFNIPPARFFLSETGSMSLTLTLGVVAFLTDQVFVLCIIGLPLIVTALSSLLQIASKKFRKGKKIFIVAPLHNHFQAKGWPPYKVTMRYWVISIFCAITGIIIAFM